MHIDIEELAAFEDEFSEGLSDSYAQVVNLMQETVSDYWQEWKLRNRSILQMIERGETADDNPDVANGNGGKVGTKLKTGRIAPRVRRHKSGLHTFHWQVYSGDPRRLAALKKKKTISRDIVEPARGYNARTFASTGAAPWEVDLVMRYEEAFKPLRETMKSIRRSINESDARIRNLNKVMESYDD